MTYPTIRPALMLDFQKSKKLDPRITFTRSSTATYLDAATGLIKTAPSGVARFEKEGFLIEEARTNIIPESTNLNNTTHWHTSTNPGSLNQSANSGWMVATTNTTEVVSPDGTNNACKLSGNTASTNDKGYKVHVVPNASSVPMSANVKYTWTLFVKDPDSVLNADNLLVLMYGSKFSNTNARVRFNLSNDTFDYGGDIANESASITPYPNGWKKLVATWTNTSSGGGPRYFIEEQSPQTNNVTQFSANGEKFYVWGFQIEEGSFPTSYIPTSGTTVTRAADVTSISNAEMLKVVNPDGNACLMTTDWSTSGANQEGFFLDSTGYLEARQWRSNKMRGNGISANLAAYTPITGQETYNTVFESRDGNTVSMGNNAGSYVSGTWTQTLPGTGVFQFGKYANSQRKQVISKILYYPQPLTQAQLEATAEAMTSA